MVNGADVGGATRWPAAKLIDDGIAMSQEPLAFQIVVLVEHVDEVLQLIGKQHTGELFAEGFLDINQRMPAVQVRQDKISHRREAQRAGEVKRVFEKDEGLAVLLHRNGRHRP